MYELSKKDEMVGADSLRPLQLHIDLRVDQNSRPVAMPVLRGQEKVMAGYDQGLGERMIVCESLEDMQELYDAYAKGYALHLNWYIGDDPGFIFLSSAIDDEGDF